MALEGGGWFRSLTRRKPADSDRVRTEGQQLAKELNVLELIAIGAPPSSSSYLLSFSCPPFCTFQFLYFCNGNKCFFLRFWGLRKFSDNTSVVVVELVHLMVNVVKFTGLGSMELLDLEDFHLLLCLFTVFYFYFGLGL
jgi:hypothetical protein